ncbi:lipoprotein [Terrabacter aerolatus]|uniref:Lipoprotein n=1 Tax=Terrabacter aerolatus TaxID=422442 RepID=A0A512D6R2_9MICO|nr:hypothetical protein [Terrabacter aerolatus]GEO32171.1 lipoprotein [Terrabacter aerolatus]
MTVTKIRLAAAIGTGALLLSGCGTTPTSPGPAPTPAQVTATSTRAAAAASSVGTPAPTESNPPGDIPDTQVYVPFTPSGAHVSVKVPEGWARATTGGSTVFSDKLNRIEIHITKATTAPTTSTVRSTDVLRLQGSVPKFASPNVRTVFRAGRPVVLLTYQGDSAVDPVTGKVVRDAFERYSYFHAGTRVDLTLSGPVNADNVDPWRTVSDSLRWTP